MIAYVVTGQGAETPGMGLDLVAAEPLARGVFETCSQATGEDVVALVQHGRPLLRTPIAQLGLTTFALACAAVLGGAGIEPSLVFGYSAGETAAASAAGCVDAGGAARLAKRRGELQDAQVARTPGTMASLRVDDAASLARALEYGRSFGRVEQANDVLMGWALLTGEAPAVRAIASRFGAVALPVNGPWHCSLLAPAVDAYRAELDRELVRDPALPFLLVDTGREATDAESVRTALSRQLAAPMRIQATIERAIDRGVSHFVVLGPRRKIGHVLESLIAGRAQLHFTDRVKDVEETRRRLRA